MRAQWIVPVLVLLMVAILVGAVMAAAQAYQLDWWTADGGGGASNGGAYSLSGTIGQPDAGSLSGSGYTLAGGFWSEAVSVPASKELYLPLVNR